MYRRALVAAALVALACARPAPAALPLKTRHHVPNGVAGDDGGYCQWACWQTLGNCLGLPELRGLKERRARTAAGREWGFVADGPWHDEGGTRTRTGHLGWRRVSPGPAYADAVRDYLVQLGVPARYRDGGPDPDFLRRQARLGLGAVLSVADYPGPGDSHAVLLVDYLERRPPAVVFYDPNKPATLLSADYAWFATHWSGKATYLEAAPARVP